MANTPRVLILHFSKYRDSFLAEQIIIYQHYILIITILTLYPHYYYTIISTIYSLSTDSCGRDRSDLNRWLTEIMYYDY